MSDSKDDTHLFREYMESTQSLGQKRSQSRQHEDDDDEREPPEPFYTPYDIEPVSGDAKLAFFNTDMHPNDRRRLIQGKYRIEDSLDLHGLTSAESAIAIDEFIKACRGDGLRCIQIIHGRGRMTGEAVLKTKVNTWLPQSPYVLAYCSCLPKHGGVGALYILLRA
jgi:DNA-nicking Smr family endonuclease